MNETNNKTQIWFYIISGLLVLIAITGLLEKSSLEYIKGISEKNLGFLGLVLELKLIINGVSDFVPFLKEHNGALNDSLSKAEHYLLIVNAISLVQLMLLEISKTWFTKIVIALLFAGTFFTFSKNLSIKLLILVLAVCPGLQIFSVTMHQVTDSTSIDYGQNYLTELRASVDTVRAEKAQIMQEHEKKMTEIDSGKKGLRIFKKLKEDISYDLKKAKTSIKGDYSELRLLLRDGGKEIVKKLFIFCTMILFTLLIIPIGYVLLVYVIYRSVITIELKHEIRAVEESLEQKYVSGVRSKVENLSRWFKSAEAELENTAKETEAEINKVQDEIDDLEK